MATAVALGGPITITATSEGKSGSSELTVARPALAQGWTLTRPISVAAGAVAAPTGYSVMLQFDHAALVGAGKSQASGNDLRVALWTGSGWVEHDRILDPGSSWNSPATRIWFRTQAEIPANSTETGYYLHYGNPAAGSNPPSDPALVFLFSDDFESGNMSRWTQSGGTWSVVTSQAHRGTRSLGHGAEGPQGRRVVAEPELDVADVYVDSWWRVSSMHPDFNSAQMARYRNNQMYYSLFCLCIGGSMGFNIASYFFGEYTDWQVPAGSPSANTWMRVGTAMHGDTYHVFYNGVQVSLQDGLDDLPSGNIGFNKYVIPPGNQLWIDDVVVRKFVHPEPQATVGTETLSP
ncbi:MAG TPA: hypothetical protein PLL69_00410 [Gemmatimonadales bacterium]|nr:hypothetical protein [Gemmatimonadales bacterium]